jgi:predicted permease
MAILALILFDAAAIVLLILWWGRLARTLLTDKDRVQGISCFILLVAPLVILLALVIFGWSGGKP